MAPPICVPTPTRRDWRADRPPIKKPAVRLPRRPAATLRSLVSDKRSLSEHRLAGVPARLSPRFVDCFLTRANSPLDAYAPSSRLDLGFFGARGTPDLHLSVDGMTPSGPNLSHWPGNRTPAKWKQDLSTSICLAYARADAREQADFLGGATVVCNDHYDTDGFGSLLAVLRPTTAFAHEELLLAAAATGDFGAWVTARAFAIDRVVARLADPQSPVANEFRGMSGPDKSLARYRWLLEHADDVLRVPPEFAPLFADERARVLAEIDAARRGAMQREVMAEIGFSHVATTDPIARMTLNTLAGSWRVLHTVATKDGPLHRYHDRTESWFELLTFHAPPRRDLRPLCARLDALEPPRDGARWCVDAPTEPIPELYFGVPSEQAYGAITRELRPSRLGAERVRAEFAGFFAEAAHG